MKNNQRIKEKIKRISDTNNIEMIKYELYSILTIIIFSKEIFKTGKDLNMFFKELNIIFKDYVLKSGRTLILARTLKLINIADEKSIVFYKNQICKLLIEYYQQDDHEDEVVVDIDEKNKQKRKDKNYMAELLNKYSRNRN